MIRNSNECVGCHSELGCSGSACPYHNVTRYYCDWCASEYQKNELRTYDNGLICIDCYQAIMFELAGDEWKHNLERVE